MQVESKEPSAAQKAKAILLATGDIPSTKEAVEAAYVAPVESQEAKDSSNEDIQADEIAVVSDSTVEAADGEIESITAGGKSVKLDWKDRDGLRKAVQMAADRNVQKADKDRALNQVKELEAKAADFEKRNTELSSILAKIADLKREGPEAALKHLFGKGIEDLRAEAEERATWTDERRENYELKQKLAEMAEQVKGTKDTSAEVLEQIRKEKEDVQRAAVENHFGASYRKHSFEGKLGGAELEDDLDTNLFNNVKAKFNSREMSSITPAEVEAAFKTERARLVKLYGSQAETRTAGEIDRKKKEALAAAQAKAGRGEGKVTAQQRFDALRKAGKYGEIAKDPVLRALL